MTCNEFKKWLKEQGCTFDTSSGKGSHIKVIYKGKVSFFPNHGSKEIKKGTRLGIMKALGLKEDK